MDAQKLLSVLDTYDLELKRWAAHASIQGLSLKPERADTAEKQSGLHVVDQMRRLSHVWWCVRQCREFVEAYRLEKAFRWLGFIQGALWYHGMYSIEELANHNRPDGEPTNLDPNRKSAA